MHIGSDPETRAVYDARVKELNDIYSGQTTRYKEGLAAGIEKGRAEGIEKGIEQGRAEERAKAAKNALSLGLSVEQVSQISELTIEEVKALKQ